MRAPGPAAVAVFLLAWAGPLRAQSLPNMRNQENWGPSEKKQFLKYLDSGGGAPAAGDVKTVTEAPERDYRVRKARYATLNLATDNVFTVTGAGRVQR